LKLTFLSCGSNYVKSHDNTAKTTPAYLFEPRTAIITQDKKEDFEG